jgi:hypothetical protein
MDTLRLLRPSSGPALGARAGAPRARGRAAGAPARAQRTAGDLPAHGPVGVDRKRLQQGRGRRCASTRRTSAAGSSSSRHSAGMRQALATHQAHLQVGVVHQQRQQASGRRRRRCCAPGSRGRAPSPAARPASMRCATRMRTSRCGSSRSLSSRRCGTRSASCRRTVSSGSSSSGVRLNRSAWRAAMARTSKYGCARFALPAAVGAEEAVDAARVHILHAAAAGSQPPSARSAAYPQAAQVAASMRPALPVLRRHVVVAGVAAQRFIQAQPGPGGWRRGPVRQACAFFIGRQGLAAHRLQQRGADAVVRVERAQQGQRVARLDLFGQAQAQVGIALEQNR